MNDAQVSVREQWDLVGTVDSDVMSSLKPDRFTLPPLPCGIIDPDGAFRTIWDLTMLLLLVYVAFSVPVVIAFLDDQSDVHIAVDLLIDMLFIIDILLNFITAFHDTKLSSLPISDLALIRSHYMRSWFVPDVISSFPVQIVFFIAPAASNLISLKLIRLLKIGRISRIGRVRALRMLVLSGHLDQGALSLLKLLLSFMWTVHLVACFYWLLTKNKEQDDTVHCEQHLGPWVLCTSAEAENDQFVRSFYFALFMILGNDTQPRFSDEYVFSIIVFILGMFVNSVIIGTLASTIANLNQQAAAKEDHFKRLNASLSYHKVSLKIRQRSRFFLDYLYSCGALDEENLLDNMSRSLQTAIEMEKKKTLIEHVEIFQDISPACTVSIVQVLTPLFVPPHEYVTVQGQDGDCMYFINRGVVQLTRVDRRMGEERPLRRLCDGGHFGEDCLIRELPTLGSERNGGNSTRASLCNSLTSDDTNGDESSALRRRENSLTLMHCYMHILSRDDFEDICEEHEDLTQILQQACAHARAGCTQMQVLSGSKPSR